MKYAYARVCKKAVADLILLHGKTYKEVEELMGLFHATFDRSVRKIKDEKFLSE